MKNLRRKAPSPIAPAEAGEEAAMTHNPNSERTADLVPRSTRRAITVARLILALPAPVTFFSWLLTSLDGPKAQRGLVGSFFYYELSWSNPLHWMSVWLGANMYVASILLQSFGKRPEIQQIDVVGTEKIFTWDAITELAIYVTFTIMSSMINMIHPSPESKVPPQRSTDLLIGTFAAAGAGCLALYLFIKTIINTKRERLSATAFRAWTVKQAGVLVFGICPFVLVCNSYAAIVMDHVPMLYFHATPNHNIFEEHASTLVCTNESVALAAIANIPDCVSSPHLFCRYDSWQTLCERIHVSEGARAAQIFILWAPLHVTLMWSVITLYSHGIATKRDTGESRSSYVHLFQPHMLLVGLLLLYVNLMLLYMLPQFLVLGQFLMSDHRIDEIIEPPGVCYGRCNDMVRNASFMACWGVIVLILNFDRFRGILREKGDKRREREAIEEAERSWDPKQPTLYFLPANYVRELPADVLPRFQELRAQGHLTRMAIPLASAFRGDDLIRTVLFISHRWELPGKPDVDGEQLDSIKEHLEQNPHVKWVWYDYSCMPQQDYNEYLKSGGAETRTLEEKAEFNLMLKAITDFYLTSYVLILLDGSYDSRFWTLTESWCAMQQVSTDGLRAAKASERRFTIKCIHNATAGNAQSLTELLSRRTPQEMRRILAKPDVQVTNAKDKMQMLPVIESTNEHVKAIMREIGSLSEA